MRNQQIYSQKAKSFSYQSRIDIVNTVYSAKGGHLGGSLSVIDILSSIYSFYDDYEFETILSKGHCLLAWICTLLRIKVLDKTVLEKYYRNGSQFGGHPKKGSHDLITWSTGSLGHGLSVACGKALANKEKNFFCIIGDGESNEGSIWEALMFLKQHEIKNLLVIIDNNKQESLDFTEKILSIEDLQKRITGIGLKNVRLNGHNIEILTEKIYEFINGNEFELNVIIADTIKGKGISFMEKDPKWHHRKIKDEEIHLCLKELNSF